MKLRSFSIQVFVVLFPLFLRSRFDALCMVHLWRFLILAHMVSIYVPSSSDVLDLNALHIWYIVQSTLCLVLLLNCSSMYQYFGSAYYMRSTCFLSHHYLFFPGLNDAEFRIWVASNR